MNWYWWVIILIYVIAGLGFSREATERYDPAKVKVAIAIFWIVLVPFAWISDTIEERNWEPKP